VRTDGIERRIKGDIGKKILFYETVGSTNAIALDLPNGENEGAVVLSDSQEKGRGRLGRTWISPPGVNIHMSVVLKPEIKAADATLITLMAGVVCAVALRKTTGLEVRIKWPNDLVVSDRKLGGILTELKIYGNMIVSAVVGVGINVNIDREGFPGEIRMTATSAKIETGKRFSREIIVAEILNEMHRWYDALKKMDREKILSGWRRLTSTIGRNVMVAAGGETYRGLAESVDEEGRLLLRLPSGEIRRVSSGDLTMLR